MNLIINQSRRFLTKGNTDEGYTEKLINHLCFLYPDYNFFELSYGKHDLVSPLPANAKKISLSIPLITIPTKEKWYQLKLKELVKQLNIDAVIHIDELASLPGVKEWLVLKEMPPKPELLQSLTGIITPSVAVKNALIKRDINPSQIKVMNFFPGETYKMLSWDDRERVKQQMADGKEYLFFNAAGTSQTHFLNVLKGFSAIKKWLKTNTKLIIINAPSIKNMEELLSTYKYKSDVKIFKEAEVTYQEILAAAFVFIYIPASKKDELPLLQSMQCGVPAITCEDEFFHEICNDAAIYINPDNEENIGEQLMKIYKDEKTRSLLIQKTSLQLHALKAGNDISIFE